MKCAVLLVSFAITVAAATALAQEAATPAWELTPYRVTMLVAVDGGRPWAASDEEPFVADLAARLGSAVGGYWKLDAAAATGELRSGMLRSLGEVAGDDLPDELGADKLILLAARPSPDGYQVQAREFDVATGLWNSSAATIAPQAEALLAAAARAALSAFAPVARIESLSGDSARLRLRGALLLPRTSGVPAIGAGSVFRPVLVGCDTLGRTKPGEAVVVPWTYLTAKFASGTAVECRIESGLAGSPIPEYHPHRQRWAVLVAPPQAPTRLRLVQAGETPQPLEGYDVLARTTMGQVGIAPKYELVGQTDHHGEVIIEPAEATVRTLLVRQARHRFVEFPLVPGMEKDVTVPIADDPRRIAIEAELDALDDRLIDLAARRAGLAARVRLATDQEDQATLAAIEEQVAKLPAADSLRAELEKQRALVAATDADTQRRLEPRLAELSALLEALTTKPDEEAADEPP